MDRTFKHLRLNNVLWIVLLLGNMEKVDGGISISPSVPEIGAVGDAVFTCDSSRLQFAIINSMQISRKGTTETDFTLLASIYRTTVAGISPNVPFLNSGIDLTTREGISLAGQGIQSDNAQVSSLQLNIQQVNLLCTDEAEYECKMTYYSLSGNAMVATSNANFTIFVPPKDLTLTVTHNGVIPGEGLQTNPTAFSVGDVIRLSCSGSIGSNPNQEFKWQRTSLSGSPLFNPYSPDAGSENKGTAPATPVNCMYSRTATLSYNISQKDGNRNTVWGFKCEAVYGTQTKESSAYYITVPEGSTMTTSMHSTGANNIDCNFEDGTPLCGWVQDKTDWFDWSTTSRAPANNPMSHGHYLSIDASAHQQNETANLIGQPFHMENNQRFCFTFWYHMYGRDMGALRLYMGHSEVKVKDTILWERQKNGGDSWKEAHVDITPPGPIVLMFEAIVGPGPDGDVAIDDIKMRPGACAGTHSGIIVG